MQKAIPHASGRINRHLRPAIAALYWLFVVFVFVASHYADPGRFDGIPLLLVGLPWSVPLLLLLGRFSMLLKQITDFIPLTTDGWNFFLIVILCGGLNAVWIMGISRVIRWFRGGWQRPLVVSASVIALVVAAEIAMPIVDRDAVERRRPQNVPKDAAHLGSGFWQHCAYDPIARVDNCDIWAQNGYVLNEGEFVPYDGGLPEILVTLPDQEQAKVDQTLHRNAIYQMAHTTDLPVKFLDSLQAVAEP